MMADRRSVKRSTTSKLESPRDGSVRSENTPNVEKEGTMERIVLRLHLILIVSILSSVTGLAQATAQLSGTVRDQSGAVLPGVEVTATQTETGVVRTTVTNETGSYSLPNLPLGPYRLEAALSGFRSFAQTGIVLAVNSSPVVNPVLEVGQVAQTVEVNASTVLVETRSV